jgi:hypothetical protein
MAPLPPKRRSPGLILLLFIVTFGIYWFVWIHKAFQEVADERGVTRERAPLLAPMVILWVLYVALVAGVMITALAQATEDTADRPDDSDAFSTAYESRLADLAPIAGAGGLLGAGLYGVQLAYLKPANRLVASLPAASQGGSPPSDTVLTLFCSLYIANGLIGFVGGFLPQGTPGAQGVSTAALLLNVAAIVLSIVWVVTAQGAINRHWASKQQATHMGGWVSNPQTPAAAAGWTQSTAPATSAPSSPQSVAAFRPDPPAASQSKVFACPDCQTRISVLYTPGVPTRVKCTNCGLDGMVR